MNGENPRPQTYVLSTFAGRPGTRGHIDGDRAIARFGFIAGITADAAGNVYVSEGTSIRKVTPDGTVRTTAGQWQRVGTNDGPADVATFGPVSASPLFQGMCVGAAGDLFVADWYNHTIRKITASGMVSTFAGLPGVAGTNDGPRNEAAFLFPKGLAMDANGILWVAETDRTVGNSGRIRKITPDGTTTTLQTKTIAQDPFAFRDPTALVSGSNGLLYVADRSLEGVWSVDPTGIATPLSTNVGLAPFGLAVNPNGDVLVSSGGIISEGELIKRIGPDLGVSLLAGQKGAPGSADGPGPEARFQGIRGVACDAAGNIYVADTGNNCIRKITPDGMVTTLVGLPGGREDGPRESARFLRPAEMAFDKAGNMYVADTLNYTVRKIAQDGSVSTFAGVSGRPRPSLDISSPFLSAPAGVAADSGGNVYVLDSAFGSGNIVRKITPDGKISTSPQIGFAHQAEHIAVASDGTSYLSGAPEFLYQWPLLKVHTNGLVEISLSGYQDGILSEQPSASIARFQTAAGISLDDADNLYVADFRNFVIRKVTPGGIVTTIAGQPGKKGWKDGLASEAQFFAPVDVAVAKDGSLYVLDNGNTVRKLSTNGIVRTLQIIGSLGAPFFYESGQSLVFSSGDVRSIAVDSSGNLYFANGTDNTIKIAVPATQPVDLKITTEGKDRVLSWPFSAAALALETTTNLADPLSWTGVTAGIITNGSNIVFTNSLADPDRSFRLQAR